jgi:cell division protein FtsQ
MSDKRRPRTGKTPSAFGRMDYLRTREADESGARRADSFPLAQWFTAHYVNRLATLLYLVAGSIALLLAYRWIVRLDFFALRSVDVQGEARRLDRNRLAQEIAGLSGNFLTLDLAAAQAHIEAVPWVRKATLERTFPDRLTVRVEEHQPLARWHGGGLVNRAGELFEANYAGALPLFEGARDRSAEITARFQELSGSLAPLGLRPLQLVLSARRAWRAKLDNGLWLELGREHVTERIKTFVAVYPSVFASLIDTNRYVDLRYQNGLAIRLNKQDELLNRPISGQDKKG